MDFLGMKEEAEWNQTLIRTALMSAADTAIIPLQDYLELGSEARINEPATLGNNWRWRLCANWQEPSLACRIRHMTELYGRC